MISKAALSLAIANVIDQSFCDRVLNIRGAVKDCFESQRAALASAKREQDMREQLGDVYVDAMKAHRLLL